MRRDELVLIGYIKQSVPHFTSYIQTILYAKQNALKPFMCNFHPKRLIEFDNHFGRKMNEKA